MSSQPSPETSTAAAPARGFFQNLLDLYIAPREAFAAITARPNWWVPFVLLTALNLGVAAVWFQKVEPTEFIKAQWEEYGITEKIPAEKRAEVLEQSAAAFYRNGWLGVGLGGPIFFVAVSALYLFVFRFFFASEVNFKQSLAIVAFSLLALSLVKGPLSLVILALKGDWNIAPEMALQAGPALLLDKQAVAKPLWALLDSLDLLTLWALWLLATGYRAASKLGASTAFIGAAIPWALYVLIKVGFSALF